MDEHGLKDQFNYQNKTHVLQINLPIFFLQEQHILKYKKNP